MRIVKGFGGPHPHVEVIGPFRGQPLSQGVIQRDLPCDIAGAGHDPGSELPSRSGEFLHSRKGMNRDPRVVSEAADIDLEAAGRGTHFGKVLVGAQYTSSQEGFFLY